MTRAWAILAAAAMVGGAVLSSVQLRDAGAGSAKAPDPGSVGRAAAGRHPPALARRYPPHSRVALSVRPAAHGVRCPDGTFLPLLNGVPAAPPITRSPHLGPVPPVIAVIVDGAGDAWYEHADGSATTTRFRRELVGGVVRINVETVHNARLPGSAGATRGEAASGRPDEIAESVGMRLPLALATGSRP